MRPGRPGPAPSGRPVPLLAMAGMIVVAGLTGCGEPPVLEVGRVGYGAEAVAGLDGGQRALLADVTAFGLAVADRRLGELARPFVGRDLRSLVLQRTALEIGAADAGLDEDALRQAYERDPALELVVRHLVVVSERWRPEEHRDSARARAAEALARARAGADFPRIVAEYSDEPGAAQRGGLLQPGREGSWVPEFWEAARSLAEGALSDVVETEYGFHVIRLEERRAVPFEEGRERALERLVELPAALARSTRWIEARTRDAVVDTTAIRLWRAGEDPEGALVYWPGAAVAPFEASDMDSYMMTLPREQAAVRDAPEPIDAVIGLVQSAARSHVLLEHARQVGIEVTRSQRTAVEQQWMDRLTGWARTLGFSPGMSTREVRSRSLAITTTHRQDMLLARQDVVRLGGVLRDLYHVEESGAADDVSAPTQ